MNLLEINLDWYVDSKGYRLVDRGVHGTRIIGRGGDLIPTRPLAKNDAVFMAFSKLRCPADVKGFIEKYGLLIAPAYDVAIRSGAVSSKSFSGQKFKITENGNLVPIAPEIVLEGEDVAQHLETAMIFHKMLLQSSKIRRRLPRALSAAMTEHLANKDFGSIGLEADANSRLKLKLTANSLINGLWLQLSAKMSGGMRYRICQLPTCSQLFEVGSQAGPRADAIYCCAEHRITSNSRKRSQ